MTCEVPKGFMNTVTNADEDPITIVVNVAVVGLLTWVVMPFLAGLFVRWLFGKID